MDGRKAARAERRARVPLTPRRRKQRGPCRVGEGVHGGENFLRLLRLESCVSLIPLAQVEIGESVLFRRKGGRKGSAPLGDKSLRIKFNGEARLRGRNKHWDWGNNKIFYFLTRPQGINFHCNPLYWHKQYNNVNIITRVLQINQLETWFFTITLLPHPCTI